eukprot:3969619-Amphidinium_carterae.1
METLCRLNQLHDPERYEGPPVIEQAVAQVRMGSCTKVPNAVLSFLLASLSAGMAQGQECVQQPQQQLPQCTAESLEVSYSLIIKVLVTVVCMLAIVIVQQARGFGGQQQKKARESREVGVQALGASTQSVCVQGPCTYTALRGVRNPRFQPLSEWSSGAWTEWHDVENESFESESLRRRC